MTRKEKIAGTSIDYHSKLYLGGIKCDFVN